MINYRVDNFEALVDQLKKDGVTVTDNNKTADYGIFVHIMDIEGNKIELWEPNDIEYENRVSRWVVRL
jgi:predicted enzyme related to lactoylglutathione lyase